MWLHLYFTVIGLQNSGKILTLTNSLKKESIRCTIIDPSQNIPISHYFFSCFTKIHNFFDIVLLLSITPKDVHNDIKEEWHTRENLWYGGGDYV